jgi:Uma2 family endonuclease
MQAARRIRWTVEGYLEREQHSPSKHEFFDGEIYAMAGATLRHNTIAANMIALLRALAKGKPCRTFTSDQRIVVPETGLYTYPDGGMVCGSASVDDRMTLSNPLMLVEVLSKSTEEYDRGEKLEHYRRIPSLLDIFLVSSGERRIDHYHRLGTGQWLLTTRQEGSLLVPIPGPIPGETSSEFAFPLEEIYENVDFTTPEQ